MTIRRAGFGVVVLGLAVLAVGAAGSSGAASVSATDPVTVDAPAGGTTPSTHDGAVGSSQPTIPGRVTTEPTFADGRVLVGTDRGLAVFADGRLQHVVPTQPVRRVVATGDGTAVVLVEDEFFPNVQAVNLDSGEVTWRAGHTVEVYSPDFGTVDRQARPHDAAPVGDVTGDGTADVAVTIGQSVLLFDGATGETVWEHDHSHNVWEVDAADGTVYAGTQDGQVLGLAADDGSTDFDTDLVDPFEMERDDVGTPHRSVWTVEHVRVGGASRVVATGEDGSAHLLDGGDGSPVWSEQVYEFDDQVLQEYYGRLLREGRLTVPGDATFSAVEATVVDRTDGVDVAVSVAVEEFPRRVGLERAPQRLHFLDGASGQQQWSTDEVSLGSTGSIAHSAAASALFVPQTPDGTTQPVVQFDTESGEQTVREYPAIPPRDRAVEGATTAYTATDGDRLALVTSTGDLLVGNVSGGVDWSYPAFRNAGVVSADFTGDGTDDYLLRSGDAGGRTAGPLQTRGFVLRDGSNGSLVWSELLDAAAVSADGGYADVQVVPDGTEGADLLAVRRPPGERSGATVVFFDGRNGTQTADIESGEIRFRSAVALGNVSERRTVFVAFDQGVTLLDLDRQVEYAGWAYRGNPDGDVPQWRPFEDGQPARYVGVGDGDGDGTREMVAVSRQAGVATVSVDSPESIRVTERAALGGDIRATVARPVGDLTGDGYEEVAVRTGTDDGPVLAIYAPGQGAVIDRLEQGRAEDIRRVSGNFAGDGSAGAVVTQVRTDAPSVTIYAGTERVLRPEFGDSGAYRQAGVSSVSPAAAAGDIDGDGADEVAVVESSTQGGARVNLTDTGSGESLDTVELAQFETENARTTPGLYAQTIPDRNGDGSPELGIVADVAGYQDLDVRYYVLDPQAGEVLLSGDGRAVEFIPTGENSVGVVSPDGSVRTVDPTTGVSISDTAPGTATDLSWEFEEEGSYVTRVYVDGYPVKLTEGTEATVRLPPGEHTIQVRATGPDGVTRYDATTVKVSGGSSLDLVLYGSTLAALAVLLAPYLVRRYRRRQ